MKFGEEDVIDSEIASGTLFCEKGSVGVEGNREEEEGPAMGSTEKSISPWLGFGIALSLLNILVKSISFKFISDSALPVDTRALCTLMSSKNLVAFRVESNCVFNLSPGFEFSGCLGFTLDTEFLLALSILFLDVKEGFDIGRYILLKASFNFFGQTTVTGDNRCHER